jgi:hypothetical protein
VASVIAAVACTGRPITDTCAVVAISGTAPHCILTAQCNVGGHTGVELDCSGTGGQCTCYINGVTGDASDGSPSTVSYQDSFCSKGSQTDVTAYESALEAANGACKWNL